MVRRIDGWAGAWTSIRAVLGATLAVAFTAAAAQDVAKPESAEPEAAALELIDEGSFKTFLNDSMGWHRRLMGAGVWVLAPDDERYFDEVRALAIRILRSGINAAEAQSSLQGDVMHRGRRETDAGDAADNLCARGEQEARQLKGAEEHAARFLAEQKQRLGQLQADAKNKARVSLPASAAGSAEREARRLDERIKALTAFEASMQSGRTFRDRARQRIVQLQGELARDKAATDPDKKIHIAFLEEFICLAVRFQLDVRLEASQMRDVIARQRAIVPELRDNEPGRDGAERADRSDKADKDRPDKDKSSDAGSRFGVPASANRTLDHQAVQRYKLSQQSEAIGLLVVDTQAQLARVGALRKNLLQQIGKIREAFLGNNLAAGSAAGLKQQFHDLVRVNLPLARQERTLKRLVSELETWRGDVDLRAKEAAKSLVSGGTLLAIELAGVLVLSWLARLAIRRVDDLKRRRFLEAVRRGCAVFLCLVFVLNAFVSDLSTFATVAGLGAAGVAFALQSLILSAVAYFFLIGRYGAHAGDRVTVAGVTGEIVEVGLFRLSLVELAGQGGDLHPTGRIVVFPNSVIFQASANFYKQQVQQSDGGYAWRELAMSLAPDCDVELAEKNLLAAAQRELAQYDVELQKLRKQAEQEMDTTVEEPRPAHRLRFAQGGLEFVLRYPVVLSKASRIDDELTRALVKAVKETPGLRLLGDSGKALIARQPAPAT